MRLVPLSRKVKASPADHVATTCAVRLLLPLFGRFECANLSPASVIVVAVHVWASHRDNEGVAEVTRKRRPAATKLDKKFQPEQRPRGQRQCEEGKHMFLLGNVGRHHSDVENLAGLDAAARDYRQLRCVKWCQKFTDHSTDQNKPRPVGGHLKTAVDLHQQ